MYEIIGLTFGPAASGGLPESYNPALVALSVVVATLASYTALDMASRVSQSQGRPALLWLLGGAFAMGAGIWSMHFIGMLAFSLPIRMAYELGITIASMLIAIAISGFALALVSRQSLGKGVLLLGGVFMGIGICAMHYTGMAAMRMFPPIRYDPLLFAASVGIAVVASMVALWLAFTLRAGTSTRALFAKMLAAVVMGLAISGMHYTGMAAASFAPGSICRAVGTAMLADANLGFAIGAVMIFILGATLLASMFDARLASQTMQMLRKMEQNNRELESEVAARREAQEQLATYAAELAQSNRELEQFAYAASHDLQAPLRTITSFVQLLQERLGGFHDAAIDEFMQHVLEGTASMHRTIHALLELGRIGKRELDFRRVPLQTVVDAARGNLQAMIEERGAIIEHEQLPEVEADTTLAVQLMQNLIANAIKFQPGPQPTVRVSARREGDGWVIAVVDRGIGIDPEHHERIFKVFQRLHTADQYEGSGIGLTLCQKIVHLHGGRIWLDSARGSGSTFYFLLPGHRPPRPADPGNGLRSAA